jgi:superfamily I DNA and RNA helicase
MPENFFRLCFHLTPGDRDSKNIVWAYDELQNIFDVKVRSPRELFGSDKDGRALVDLERASSNLPPYLSNDVVLHKSYRNPKEVLIAAHALGFGLYSDQIVQMLENREHWEDIGYQVINGDFRTGSPTVILRPDENSPLSLSKHEAKDNIVRQFVAPSIEKEVEWVVQEISQFLADGLRPEDILVISLDDRNARKYFGSIQEALLKQRVVCNNILDNPYTSSRFAVNGMVTLSTVHRAKGNEAAAVIALGIDALFQLRKGRIGRNRIFAAFTRTKAWLRVCGVGDNAAYFLKELSIALEKSPNLEFSFPDLKQVSLLQRDMSKREAKLLKLREKYKMELKRLGLHEEDMAEFFAGEEKK